MTTTLLVFLSVVLVLVLLLALYIENKRIAFFRKKNALSEKNAVVVSKNERFKLDLLFIPSGYYVRVSKDGNLWLDETRLRSISQVKLFILIITIILLLLNNIVLLIKLG